jgi:hypothetical protein
MVGTDVNPIQIDEARFAGRRKYNRGGMLNGDNPPPPRSEDSDADLQNNRNHGRRIDGPWVFALKQGSDCRYFYVQRRDRNILIPIIHRECETGSVIHSDEWPAYGNVNAIGYSHFTVNHQENYVDPRILKKMTGVPNEVFQSHLDHICWKVLREDAEDWFFGISE